jgi:hypothetical protein
MKSIVFFSPLVLYSRARPSSLKPLSDTTMTREGWTGIGGAPNATSRFVYISFRYHIP